MPSILMVDAPEVRLMQRTKGAGLAGSALLPKQAAAGTAGTLGTGP